MRHIASTSILAAGLLLATSPAHAQDLASILRALNAYGAQPARSCSTLGVKALKGTYSFTATGAQDMSELNPTLPKGYAPLTIIGAFKVSSNGGVTGWALVNAGGVSMTAEFVDSQFGAPRADCSIPISLSMKIKEYGGVVTGPYPYVGVIAGDDSALQIAFMMLGMGPGAHIELNHARRISMSLD